MSQQNLTAEQRALRQRSVRMGLILGTIAVAFFAGVIIKFVLIGR